jgi:hypothetical protein
MAADSPTGHPDPAALEAERKRRRRGRSIAIAVALAVLVVLFYLITIFKLGGSVVERPL